MARRSHAPERIVNRAPHRGSVERQELPLPTLLAPYCSTSFFNRLLNGVNVEARR
jgi:hypothetical protein